MFFVHFILKYKFFWFFKFLIFLLLKIKQECWWLYVADRKHYSLISAPVYLCTLKDKEEVCWKWIFNDLFIYFEKVEIKFSAPKIPGHHVYSVILRSDSYFDVDVIENLSVNWLIIKINLFSFLFSLMLKLRKKSLIIIHNGILVKTKEQLIIKQKTKNLPLKVIAIKIKY